MRPEILFPLFADVSTLKGVGPRSAPLVHKVAGPLVRDVLFLSPSGIIQRRRTTVHRACADSKAEAVSVPHLRHMRCNAAGLQSPHQ